MLCRNGRAIQLTDDHKPEREDEAVGGPGWLARGMLALCCAEADAGEPHALVCDRLRRPKSVQLLKCCSGAGEPWMVLAALPPSACSS